MEAKRKGVRYVEVLESEVLRLRGTVDQLSSLKQLAILISTAQDLDAINRCLVRQSLYMIGAEQGVVTLVAEDSSAAMSTLVRTRVNKESPLQEYRPNDAVVGWMRLNKKPLRLKDVRMAPAFDPKNWHTEIRSLLCVPLMIKTRLIGLLTLFNKTAGREFEEDDERLLFIIAMQSAQVIENQRLLQVRNQELEEQVAEKTAVLRQKNLELEKTLADLRRTQQQLIQQEKLVSLGQLSAGIAHQIRNPLNFINNFAQLNEELIKELEEKPEVTVEEVRDLIQNLKLNESKINEHGQRADRIVQSLMYHASRAAGERERKDLNILVDEYINLAYHGMRAQRPDFNVNIERAYDEGAGEIVVVPQDIGQVLVNLCNNAFDAMQEEMARRGNGDGTKPDGVYEPRLTVRTNRLSNRVEIQIADNGPGVPKAERGRIFEPFFTTKTLGSGTGLGLSLSQDIVVKGHGGSLAVESAEPGGAVFIVKLPA